LALHVCAREDGIRRSKDLRAEVGKFPNSTNERKQMSTKTIKQRIALVAVTALSAGFISVVAAPAANATAFDSATAAGYVQIATVGDTDGTPNVSGGIASTSVGWLVDTSATAAATNSTTIIATGAKTGNILAGAKLGIMASNTASANMSIVVTGGTLSSLSVTTGATLLNGSATTAVATAATAIAADNITMGAIFSVSAAAGSTATIAAYSGASNTITTTSTATGGTLLGIWTLTVVASSASGTMSVADSYAVQQACIVAGSTTAGTTTAYDTTTRCNNGELGQIYVDLYDAYSARVTGGALAASTTAGYVNVVNSASVTAGNTYETTTAFDTANTTTNANYILVTQPTANTAGSATVTITYKGAIVATKTISWNGAPASIAVDPTNTAKSFYAGAVDTSTTYLNNVIYVVKDAAGNAITTTTNPTVSDATGSMVGATLSTSSTTTTVYANATQTSARGYAISTMLVPSADANKGAGTYRLKFVTPSGAAIYSQTMNATVSNGATSTFTASWDKASYVSGDIATLTITVKDQYGNLMATGSPLTGLTDNILVASGLTVVGGACSSSSTVTDGVKTCKYAAGNTAGSYSWSIDLTTSPVNQSATVGVVKVTDATAAVSNADVLKSIVALIASINKQIQALQKLILKR